MGETVVFFGPSGSGKTSQALGWPGPTVVFDLEYGLHRAWGVTQKDNQWLSKDNKAITRHVYHTATPFITSRDTKLEGCLENWSKFTSDFLAACKKGSGTIIVDTATIVWKLCCDAYLQQLQMVGNRERLQEIEYGEPNRRMGLLFESARQYNTNLILIHHERDEYVQVMEPVTNTPQVDRNGRPVTTTTGKKLPDGYKYSISKADWVLYSVGPEDGSKPSTTIRKSPAGWSLVGLTVEDFNYGKLEQVVALSNGVEV